MLNFREKRSERRRKIFLRAEVSGTGAGATTAIDCIIRDVSRSGCKLESEDINGLANDLCLAISGFSEPIRGQLVWQNGNFAGVRFIRDNTIALPVSRHAAANQLMSTEGAEAVCGNK